MGGTTKRLVLADRRARRPGMSATGSKTVRVSLGWERGMGLHVDTTAHFSRRQRVGLVCLCEMSMPASGRYTCAGACRLQACV